MKMHQKIIYLFHKKFYIICKKSKIVERNIIYGKFDVFLIINFLKLNTLYHTILKKKKENNEIKFYHTFY